MWTKLQGAIIAVLEERLAVNAKEFFELLSRDPARVLSHWCGSGYSYNLPRVKTVSTGLSKL
jgi:hypothetical protein